MPAVLHRLHTRPMQPPLGPTSLVNYQQLIRVYSVLLQPLLPLVPPGVRSKQPEDEEFTLQ